ncbi:primosome assembly protein PriA [Janibacter sp. Soil728]|uniref:primosomal protein N' family DNA-binding protein n=1 Tax=Janibacter sp. Soil728 TaxID=1736393 RepID=UPI0009E85EC4|nr:primosome assembly protein PriA [Janibacter sp. Soil728]
MRVAQVLIDSGLVHLDRPFEYLVPEELDEAAQPGVRIKARFAGRDLAGYVVERSDVAEHTGRLAPVRTVVSPEQVLTPHILEVARRLARHQAGTVMDVLRLAIPPRHARAEKALSLEPPQPAPPQDDQPQDDPAQDDPATVAVTEAGEGGDPPSSLTPPEVWSGYRAGSAWWSRVAGGESPRAAWIAGPSRPPETDWPQALAAAARGALLSGRGSVIVVPDQRDLARVDAALTEVLGPGQHVRLSADQGPQARYTAWLKVLRGHVRVVVGTRAAAYAPVHDLGLVAWWDDGDDLHQEPRAPYTHVRDVLTTRADVEDAALLVGGLAMSIDVAALVEAGVVHLVGGSTPRREAPRVVVAGEGVDEERDGPGARAHIPSSAHRAAAAALTCGPVLIQVPRRGYLPAMSCATCRAPARCPECQGPLALPSPDRAPECGWCGRSPRGFLCPHCDGDRLRAGIIGARRTAEEIGRSFPGTRVITSGAGDVQESVGAEPAIVVSTPGAEPVAEGGYAAVLLLDAWASLDRPDLRAAEEAVRRWFAASGLARPWTDGGLVVLCGAPSHVTIPAVEALVRWDPQWFAARELTERAELSLPPTTWSAEIQTDRKRIEAIEHAVRAAAPAAQLLGPLPVPGSDQRRRLVVTAPFADGPLVAAALKDVRAGESARKAPDLTSVKVGHLTTG